jgi:hypothetical protein
MAKPPPEEFFEITVKCPKNLMGDTMSMLTKLGLSDVHFNLVEATKSFTRNANPEVSSIDFLTAWTSEHPTFKAREAVKAFRDDGRGNGSTAYHTLTALVKDGVLKKLDEGRYSRADVKALVAPKKTTKQVQVHRDVDHRTFLLRAASRNHGRFSTSWMKAQFEKDGRIPGNVSPTIATLMKKKALKRVGDSEYVLPAKAAPKKTEVKTNGNAAAIETPVGV